MLWVSTPPDPVVFQVWFTPLQSTSDSSIVPEEYQVVHTAIALAPCDQELSDQETTLLPRLDPAVKDDRP
jgi:hypothetical protein